MYSITKHIHACQKHRIRKFARVNNTINKSFYTRNPQHWQKYDAKQKRTIPHQHKFTINVPERPSAAATIIPHLCFKASRVRFPAAAIAATASTEDARGVPGVERWRFPAPFVLCPSNLLHQHRVPAAIDVVYAVPIIWDSLLFCTFATTKPNSVSSPPPCHLRQQAPPSAYFLAQRFPYLYPTGHSLLSIPSHR